MKFRLSLQHTSPDSSSAPRALRTRPLHRLAPALALLLPLLPACADGTALSEDELVLGDAQTTSAPSSEKRGAPVTAALTTMAVKTSGATAEDESPDATEQEPELGATTASAGELGSQELPVASAPADNTVVGSTDAVDTTGPGDTTGPADTVEPATSVSSAPVPGPTMRTEGRRLLDACGNVFVTRGVEQIFGNQLPEGNDWLG